LLHCQRDFERDRRNCFDEQVSDRLVDSSAWNMLADRFSVFNALALTSSPNSAVVSRKLSEYDLNLTP
jgi:hypothetical protein